MIVISSSVSDRKTNSGLVYKFLALLFLTTLVFFIPSFSTASVTTTYEYNALDRVSVVGSETSFTEVYPR
jgi:hypothetical protein